MQALTNVFVAIATLAAFFFVFWLPFSLVLPPGRWQWILRIVGLLFCVVVMTLYTRRNTSSVFPGLVKCIFLGAVIAGLTGFAAGFFGPMIFEPGANQGPLLGIFITGPLGFLAGLIGGAIYWFVRLKRTPDKGPDRTIGG